MTLLTGLHVIAGGLLAVAAGLAVVRIVRGPTILDRMIASDVVLTILILVVGAEMVIDGHTRTIPLMLVLTGAAALATIAVARYVSKQDDTAKDEPGDGS